MSDNNIKTNVNETVKPVEAVAEAIEEIEKIEDIEKAHDKAVPTNGGAEKVLELYQKISASGLPYSEKEPLLKKLLSEWKKIVEDISEKALNAQPELSVGYILSQIEKIQQDNEHIFKAISVLDSLVLDDGVGDIANQARCEAIRDVAVHREATNQKLIAFYEKLYDDIKPEPVDFNHFSLEQIVSAIERCDAGVMSDETSKALKSVLLDRLRATDINDSYKLKFESLADLITSYNEPSISDLRCLAQSLKKG